MPEYTDDYVELMTLRALRRLVETQVRMLSAALAECEPTPPEVYGRMLRAHVLTLEDALGIVATTAENDEWIAENENDDG